MAAKPIKALQIALSNDKRIDPLLLMIIQFSIMLSIRKVKTPRKKRETTSLSVILKQYIEHLHRKFLNWDPSSGSYWQSKA